LPYLNLQTYKLTNLQTYKLTNLQTYKLTNLQTYKLTNLQDDAELAVVKSTTGAFRSAVKIAKMK
jgi:hypothetical protein